MRSLLSRCGSHSDQDLDPAGGWGECSEGRIALRFERRRRRMDLAAFRRKGRLGARTRRTKASRAVHHVYISIEGGCFGRWTSLAIPTFERYGVDGVVMKNRIEPAQWTGRHHVDVLGRTPRFTREPTRFSGSLSQRGCLDRTFSIRSRVAGSDASTGLFLLHPHSGPL